MLNAPLFALKNSKAMLPTEIILVAVLMGGLGGAVRFIKALSSKIDTPEPVPSIPVAADRQLSTVLPARLDQRGQSASTGTTTCWCYEGQPLTMSVFFGNAARDSMLGMAGGMSLAGLAAALNVLNPEQMVAQTQIAYIAAFFVAGVAGRKVLDFATDKLMKQLSAAESQIVRAQQSLKEAHVEIEQQATNLREQSDELKKQRIQLEETARRAQRAQVITMATTQLARALPSEMPGVVRDLRDERESAPGDRTITVLLGRAYRLNGDLDLAIATLDEFLGIINRDERVEDYADALYNRACYKALKAANKVPDSEGIAQSALRDLRTSVALVHANFLDAEKDEDFKYLRTDYPDEWKQIAGIAPQKTSS